MIYLCSLLDADGCVSHMTCACGCRQLPGQQCDVPNEVLGVPACMVPAEQYAADFDGQLYDSHLEEPALPAEAWFPEQSCSQPCGLDAAQIKQLYRQLNQHCQLMIQVYALTARNSQHQQTAASVKQLLEQYQVTLHCCTVALLCSHLLALSACQAQRCVICHRCSWKMLQHNLFMRLPAQTMEDKQHPWYVLTGHHLSGAGQWS